MENAEIRIIISYKTLRKAIGILALLLPLILFLWDIFSHGGVTILSISGFYHSSMRDFFLGLMFIVSVFLISYNGFDARDQIITSVSGVFGLLLSLFPVGKFDSPSLLIGIFQQPSQVSNPIHLISAVLFFLMLAIMSFFLFTLTDQNEPGDQKKFRNLIYRICGIFIVLALIFCGLSMTILKVAFTGFPAVLIGEWVALWAFGISWLIKGETFLVDKKSAA